MKSRGQAFQKFKNWKKMIETQTSRKVKKLRINNGYLKEKFDLYVNKKELLGVTL